MKFFIDSILYSYSQIFLSNRRWFGALACASTFFMPEFGLAGLLGVILSNLIASILKFDSNRIRSGFYGFNGILFAMAALFYFKLNIYLLIFILIFIIINFLISAVIENYFAIAFNLPGLSLPFVISIIIFSIFISNFNLLERREFLIYDFEYYSNLPDFILEYFKAHAYIFLQPSITAGIILSIGILLLSRIMFLSGLIGFTVTYLIINLFVPLKSNELYLIIAGFNSILTGYALGGCLILPSRKTPLMIISGSILIIIITVFLNKILISIGLPLLVLPFNIIVLTVLYGMKFRQEQSDFVLLYFNPGTPEENYYYHQNQKIRFGNIKLFHPELPFYGEWFVSQAFDGEFTHKNDWRYAWDFIVLDSYLAQNTNEGNKLEDFYSYRLPVRSTLNGEVVSIENDVDDNEIKEQNLEQNWGNTVVLYHAPGLYSCVSHLMKDSIKLKIGDSVKVGDILGFCGNSGRSLVPHLHFQFQSTGKIGDVTLKYPFSNYIEKIGDSYKLRIFDYPEKNSFVSNLELNYLIYKSLKFYFGEEFKFRVSFQKNINMEDIEEFEEKWEVKANYLTSYIESSQGATLSFFLSSRMFRATGFEGNRHSALYEFFKAGLLIPITYIENLSWDDEFALSEIIHNTMRFFSEFVLLFNPQIKTHYHAKFDNSSNEDSNNQNIIIKSEQVIEGQGLFRFYQRIQNSEIEFEESVGLKSFSSKNNKDSYFKAERIV